MYNKTINTLNARRRELETEIESIDGAISHLSKLGKTEKPVIMKKAKITRSVAKFKKGSKANSIVQLLTKRSKPTKLSIMKRELVGPRKMFKTSHALSCQLSVLKTSGKVTRTAAKVYSLPANIA